jgi:MinD superfamily P-loop ATPase
MSTLASGVTPSKTSGGINMKSVVFYNNKGGVGKTTFAVHCALRAALHHRLRTVAIGLDRQGDILRWISGGEVWVGDGTVHQHSPNLTVIYSPNQQPNLRLNADLAVMDSSPSLALAGSVRADLVVVPIDGRLALDDLQNALPDLIESQAKLLVVMNRADAGGARTLAALKRACAKVPKMTVWSHPVPDSARHQARRRVLPPGVGCALRRNSEGSQGMKALCDDILRTLGLGARR